MLHIQCPHCNKSLEIDEKYAGKTGACNGCGRAIVVPALAYSISAHGSVLEEIHKPPPTHVKEDFSEDKYQGAGRWKTISIALIALLLIGLPLAFQAGREHRNREIANGIAEAFAGIGQAFSGGQQFEPPKADRPGRNATWHDVIEFSGNTSRTTETFNIPENEWRITYQANVAGQFGGTFSIWAKSPSNPLAGDLVANQIGSTQDTSFLYERGEFYLDIGGSGMNWRVKVEAKY